MPIIGFSLLGVGGLFIYSGYLGYTPAQIVKAILNGKLSTLPKIPIDPRKQASKPVTSGNSSNGDPTTGQGAGGGGGGSF